MKNRLAKILFAILTVLATSCQKEKEPEIIKVADVTLDITSLSLIEGESQTLSATVSPQEAANKKVIWSTSNASVAGVDNGGKVTAVTVGSATITVKTDDGGKTATCAVTVNAKVYPVESVSLDKTAVELTEGETATLTATVKPENASDKTVSWSSSQESVATVTDGVITAVAPGEATITVTTNDGGKTATCKVTVKRSGPEMVDLGLSVKWASYDLGATRPEEHGCRYQWAGLEDVSEIPNSAFSTLRSIYPYHKEGPFDDPDFWFSNFTKYVTEDYPEFWGGPGSPDNKVILDPEDDVASVTLGEKWRIPTYYDWMELQDNCTCTWTNNYNNTGVAGIIVSSNKAGYTGNSIFLPAIGYWSYWSSNLCLSFQEYGMDVGYYTTCEFGQSLSSSRSLGKHIRPVFGDFTPVSSISLDETSVEIEEIGSEQWLYYTLLPKYASNQKVFFSIDNPSVATITTRYNGIIIKALSPGMATITATTLDGGKTATCKVTVKAPLPSGALPGEFSVSDTKKVHFSKGNLQATIDASQIPTAWKFAANQYDYLGYLSNAGDDFDLFAWSTDAISNNWGIHFYNISEGYTTGNFKDWGVNIGDGNTWRTLTKEEWQYLFNNGNYQSDIRKNKYKYNVEVCGKILCTVLLPDSWQWGQNGVGSTWQTTYPEKSTENYPVSWKTMEAAGAVCLPAAGYRFWTIASGGNDYGIYWSSSLYDSDCAYCVYFDGDAVDPSLRDARSYGHSVRLVTEVE